VVAPLLDVQGLRVVFGRRTVLDGVSFQLRRGEALGIVGSNGSGKSTTLKAVLGLVPYDGVVRWNVSLEKVGYVPQRPALYLDFTVAENIATFSKLVQDPVDVGPLLEYFDLKPFLSKPARLLSGGYQKVLNVVLSLLSDPQVLLLDEPTAELDYSMRDKLMDFLREFVRSGRAVMMVTHVPGEVEEVCTRTVVLGHGKIVAEGPPDKILERAHLPYVIRIYGSFESSPPLPNFRNAKPSRVEDDFIELCVDYSRLLDGMEEVLGFARSVGAERIVVEEPDILRAVELGVVG